MERIIGPLALDLGLSPHQAEVAGIVVGLVEGYARLAGSIRAHYAARRTGENPDAGAWPLAKRIDEMVTCAVNAAAIDLSRQLDNLGLSLSRDARARLETIICGLGRGTPRTLASVYADQGALIDMCRSAPAEKPARPAEIRHAGSPPVAIVPYWQGSDAELWPAGVVM